MNRQFLEKGKKYIYIYIIYILLYIYIKEVCFKRVDINWSENEIPCFPHQIAKTEESPHLEMVKI